MPALRISLFGSLVVTLDNRALIVGVPTTKALELFAYLLIQRRRTHPREALAALLWPELAPAHAKKNLRKVLCSLQHLLGEAVGTGHPPILLVAHDWVGLNPALELWLDVAALEEAYALAQRPPGGTLDSQTSEVIAGAVALCEGELLAGLYADWCLHERERLENMCLELRHLLLIDAERQQAYEQAIAHGLAILRHDHANERAHRDLMRLYYVSGNRSAALRQYGSCVAALVGELGVRPRRCTEQLYRQICRDEPLQRSDVPERERAAPEREQQAEAPGHGQLQQVRAELERVLRQVQVEIEQVERLLSG